LTPDKRIHAHIQDFENILKQRLTEKPGAQSAAFPIQIVTRRLMGMMNSWLAETTGMSGTECSGDFIEMNTEDAASLGISDGQQVEVRSTVSSVRVVARVSDHVRSGVAIMEHGWGSRIFDPAGENPPEVYGVNRNLLVANDDLDPLASVPRLNGMPVQIVVI
jgi:formate dehydrogenase